MATPATRDQRIASAAALDGLDALRAALGFERVTLVGHARGAVLAALYAGTRPDRAGSLVLLNTAELTAFGEVGALDPMRTLAGIRSPTLVVHADMDPIPVAWAHALVDAIPGADFVLLEGTGFSAHSENAERLAGAVLPWLFTHTRRRES